MQPKMGQIARLACVSQVTQDKKSLFVHCAGRCYEGSRMRSTAHSSFWLRLTFVRVSFGASTVKEKDRDAHGTVRVGVVHGVVGDLSVTSARDVTVT